ADRVGIIDAGKIAVEGTPEDLKRSVGQDLVVATTRGEANGAVDRLRALEAVDKVDVRGEELTIATPDGPRVVGKVAVVLEESGVPVERLTLRTPTLDDVFLKVTGNRIGTDDGNMGEEDGR
ncbi:MAG: Efflux ABC transporter, ATP-binding protein, partial [uncultured Rubrobacteraceae bacterium]